MVEKTKEYNYPLGIGIVPSIDQQNSIYGLVSKIKNSFSLSFVCEEGVSTPHLTIFQGKYKCDYALNEVIKNLPVNLLSDNLKVKGISIWAGKIIFLDFEKTDNLITFHNETFKKTAPLSEGESADPQNFIDISDKEQEMFDKTGYPFSLNAYKPHITIAHLEEIVRGEEKKDIEKKLNQILKESELGDTLSFEKLVVYRVGKFGSCLDDFSLEVPIGTVAKL